MNFLGLSVTFQSELLELTLKDHVTFQRGHDPVDLLGVRWCEEGIQEVVNTYI